MGKIYLQEQDYSQAISNLEEALNVINNEIENQIIRSTEALHEANLDPSELSEDFELIEIGYLPGESQILLVLATAYLKSGNQTKAIEHAQTAIENLEAVKEQLEQLSNLNSSIGQIPILMETQLVLGRALFETGQFAAAETNLQQAFEQIYRLLIEPASYNADFLFNGGQFAQIFYVEILARISSQLQQVLIAQGKVTDALEISEQGRAVIFKQNLAQLTNTDDNPVSAEEQIVRMLAEHNRNDQRHYLETELAQSNLTPQERQSFEQRLAGLEEYPFEEQVREQLPELVADYGGAENFFAFLKIMLSIPFNSPTRYELPKTTILTFRDIQAIAKAQQTTLVQYSVISDNNLDFVPSYLRSPENRLRFQQPEKEILIWVVQPSGEMNFRSVPIPEGQTLGKFVANSRAQLGIRGYGFSNHRAAISNNPEQILQDLHQLLIAPIQDLLPQDPNQHVTLIPDGSLFLVPFPALLNSSGEALIDHHTILINPSIQAIEKVSNFL